MWLADSTYHSDMMLITRLLVASMLVRVSFLPPPRAPLRQMDTTTQGGSWATQPKYEYGARLTLPSASTVEHRAMGRGTTALIMRW